MKNKLLNLNLYHLTRRLYFKIVQKVSNCKEKPKHMKEKIDANPHALNYVVRARSEQLDLHF